MHRAGGSSHWDRTGQMIAQRGVGTSNYRESQIGFRSWGLWEQCVQCEQWEGRQLGLEVDLAADADHIGMDAR